MADPNKQGIDMDYPIAKGNMGYFQQTFDTFDSERNKLINLMSTHEGERVMQPKFGLGIEKYLFEQITSDLSSRLQSEIRNKIGFWLPNLQINNLSVDIASGVDRNTVTITIDFSLKANPSEFDVVTFTF
jgi:phage baseplate assembly protein W